MSCVNCLSLKTYVTSGMGFEGKIQTLVLMYVLFLIFKIKTHIYIFSKRYFIPIKWFQNQTQNGFEKGHGNW